MRRLLAVGLTAGLAASLLPSCARAGDEEALARAKTLYFDRHYTEARRAWQAVAASSTGADAQTAAYWIARCSENLKEDARALGEYEAYLAARPSDPALAEEARISRVALAARLYKAGERRHLPLLNEALDDPSKTVRYYAALQLASLGAPAGKAAVPVLQGIVSGEKDEDLVERAKIALLRLEPRALAQSVGEKGGPAGRKDASWIRVRIYKAGAKSPEVSINLPVALAELVFKSLPDETRHELQLKGYDADTFWERLRKLGKTEILSVEGDEGERIQVWLE
jgi:hypothetical protein